MTNNLNKMRGQMVDYVIAESDVVGHSDHVGKIRPAIVVDQHRDEAGNSTLDLHVIVGDLPCSHWRPGAVLDDQGQAHSAGWTPPLPPAVHTPSFSPPADHFVQGPSVPPAELPFVKSKSKPV